MAVTLHFRHGLPASHGGSVDGLSYLVDEESTAEDEGSAAGEHGEYG